jgi:malate synthase
VSRVTAADLLNVPSGEITGEGLARNIDVGLQYLAAWLRGNGCVPIYNLMEDAATAEICRAQVWQWMKHGAKMSDGRAVTVPLVREVVKQQCQKLAAVVPQEALTQAADLYEQMMTNQDFPEFLTLGAYELLD